MTNSLANLPLSRKTRTTDLAKCRNLPGSFTILELLKKRVVFIPHYSCYCCDERQAQSSRCLTRPAPPSSGGWTGLNHIGLWAVGAASVRACLRHERGARPAHLRNGFEVFLSITDSDYGVGLRNGLEGEPASRKNRLPRNRRRRNRLPRNRFRSTPLSHSLASASRRPARRHSQGRTT